MVSSVYVLILVTCNFKKHKNRGHFSHADQLEECAVNYTSLGKSLVLRNDQRKMFLLGAYRKSCVGQEKYTSPPLVHVGQVAIINVSNSDQLNSSGNLTRGEQQCFFQHLVFSVILPWNIEVEFNCHS